MTKSLALRSTFRVIAVFASLLILLAACGGESNESDGENEDHLTVGVVPGAALYTVYYAGKEKGIYDQHEIDVEIVNAKDGAQLLQLATGGNIDISQGSYGLVFNAIAAGQTVDIVGATSTVDTYNIHVRSELADDLPTDADWEKKMVALKGRTIGVTGRGSGVEQTFQKLASLAGMDSKNDFTFSAVGDPFGALGQFQSDRIDAYIYPEPAGVVFQSEEAAVPYISIANEAPAEASEVLSGALFASRATVTKKAEPLDRFLEATEETLKWLNDPENLDEAVNIFKDQAFDTDLNVSDKAIAESLRDVTVGTVYASALPALIVPRDVFENSKQLLVDAGDIAENDITYEDSVRKGAQE